MLKEAGRTVLASVSVLYDRVCWWMDERRLARLTRRLPLKAEPMVEEPPHELRNPLGWYAEFFTGIRDDPAVYWPATELFLWVYPDILSLREYVPEQWERVR